MNAKEQRAAAKKFAEQWAGRGDEKSDTQVFWINLLQDVFAVSDIANFIAFEVPVKIDHVSYIDGYIDTTSVLIEQKGIDIDLKKSYKQSDSSMLTPFQQARRYAGYLPHTKNPRWIIVCNFAEFHIHDMNRPNDPPEIVYLKDLEKEYERLRILVDTGSEKIQKEMEVSLAAGDLVGKLYDALLKQYKNPEDPIALQHLNMLCVRLVFCLYAEDARIFGRKGMFHDYMEQFPAKEWRQHLIEFFRVLDTPEGQRDPYMEDDLAAFPYVNGGLFADENIEIPRFTDEIVDLILNQSSRDFDWSQISPTIFGAVFESTLNPETRRSGGMHYTSVENIHKVIDPLFLDDLKVEFEAIKGTQVLRTREKKLKDFQKKLASLTFFDPACGSGNFLTETYLSIRRLENKALALLLGDQIVFGFGTEEYNPIQVSIGQFYGIEINDFAVSVAKTALWIAESQMMKETEDVVHMSLDFLPLKSYVNIVEGNALRMDWEDVVKKEELDYIIGNPPFKGARWMSEEQKEDVKFVFGLIDGVHDLDFVTSWYRKAAEFMKTTNIETAYVSTNSICQGVQVPILWKTLINDFGIQINFAYQSFKWESESKDKAAVHCVIIGFSAFEKICNKRIFNENGYKVVNNISPYLTDSPTIFIESRKEVLCKDIPKISMGNMARDGGHLFLTEEERDDVLKKEPELEKWIYSFVGADEFIKGKKRWCFWLKNATPDEIAKSSILYERVRNVREFRLASKAKTTNGYAKVPHMFAQISQPDTSYVVVPVVSSERRRYIPIGFLPAETISSCKIFTITDTSLYHLGVLTSNVHMAWMRTVAGRMKSDYSYSKEIVYNNFPWPSPTEQQKEKIEKTAQAILNARELYPDKTLKFLYDEVTMPSELRKAHQENDMAVMEAYGFRIVEDGKKRWLTEPETVAELMKMYQKLTEK